MLYRLAFDNIQFDEAKFLSDAGKIFKQKWIKIIKPYPMYFNTKINALFPDANFYDCFSIPKNIERHTNFWGFKGRLINLKEIRKIFIDDTEGNPFINNIKFKNKNLSFDSIALEENRFLKIKGRNKNIICKNNGGNDKTLYIPCFSLEINDKKTYEYLKIFHLNGLIPEGLELLEIIENIMKDKLIYNDEKIKKVLKSDKLAKSKFFDRLKKENILKSSDLAYLSIENWLLNSDKERADIEPYDPRLLTDPNRGHWELWENISLKKKNKICLKLAEKLWARNPLIDIIEHGLVGIDFGTKSTVVVCQNDNETIRPLRIGIGEYSKKPAKHHYENPTVIELRDLNKFISDYNASCGRPRTSWEDITISHTAFNKMTTSSNSDEFNSFFYELKQWAGDKNRVVRLRDINNKKIIILPSYLSVGENDFDPIEIYAYYLGLYINNMHKNTGIFFNYILSFPVTFSPVTCNKLLMSFEKGIKKSLPESLIKNKDVMKKFRIRLGASEPAAYAVCALKEYGFYPSGEEKIYYGVFDFGGGTTDFDFGIWREADHSKREEENFDYVIHSFGSEGDKHLGGENLLEMMAYEVYKENLEIMRENSVVFARPPECPSFAGDEAIVNTSLEARINMHRLAEKLRPFWEETEKNEKVFDKGQFKLNVFSKDGSVKIVNLNVDAKKLKNFLRGRIEKGINNFFEAIKLAFSNIKVKGADKVHIFLAGNSCKSSIVKELFNYRIKLETQKIQESKKKHNDVMFEIYYPLGTEEATKKLKERNISLHDNNLNDPNGKTGVAFGLLMSRAGGRIKVENGNIFGNEIRFNYYIGQNRKDKFKVIVDREVKYNEWVRFIAAQEEVFELYYTSQPQASTMEMSIKDVNIKRKRIPISKPDYKSADVYIRVVSPSQIEFVVATQEGIKNESYISEIKMIELEAK